MGEKIRSFIALELSDETKAELSRIEETLKKTEADVKWVKPGSIHLTLKFLGYVTEEQIASITKKIEEIASEVSPFDAVLDKVGVFPGWSRPRVIWVGIGGETESIKKLAELVEDAAAEEGIDKENRPFKSHLTIGRVRSPKNKEKLEKEALAIEVKPVLNHITKIVLFKSDLTPKGAIYTPLVEADLGKSE